MVGRGALMNPFLICKLRGNYIAENRAKEVQFFRLFHDELFESYSSVYSGPAHLLGKMKSLWLYFSHFFPQNTKLLKKLKKTKAISDYESLISQVTCEDN
jgi:tRNA-dihydrouridine synthase